MASDQDSLEQIGQADQCSLEEVERLYTAMDTDVEGSGGTPAAANEAAPTSLAEALLDEMKVLHRKVFGQGDVAIILDPNDLSKTLLIPHNQLKAATNTPHFTTADSQNEIRCAFVLPAASERNGTQIPHLQGVDPAQAVNDFYNCHRTTSAHAKSVQEASIKTEDPSLPTNFEDEQQTDWQGAYKAVLAMIVRASPNYVTNLLSSRDGEPAILQIRAVNSIALQYDAVSTVQTSMESVLRRFQERRTLWKSIAADPASWLSIGRDVQDKMVYEEAMIHLIGAYPSYGDQMRQAGVPDDVRQLVERKSQHLKYYRMGIDQELLTMSLEADPDENEYAKGGKKALKRKRVVGLDAMLTLYEWRDYIATQIRNLDDTKVVPFYRSLHLGGDSYLPADELIRDWRYGDDESDDTIRETLRRLKREASRQVEPLVKSKLKYEEKEEVEYLTCVEVEECDVPWQVDGDVEMEED